MSKKNDIPWMLMKSLQEKGQQSIEKIKRQLNDLCEAAETFVTIDVFRECTKLVKKGIDPWGFRNSYNLVLRNIQPLHDQLLREMPGDMQLRYHFEDKEPQKQEWETAEITKRYLAAYHEIIQKKPPLQHIAVIQIHARNHWHVHDIKRHLDIDRIWHR